MALVEPLKLKDLFPGDEKECREVLKESIITRPLGFAMRRSPECIEMTPETPVEAAKSGERAIIIAIKQDNFRLMIALINSIGKPGGLTGVGSSKGVLTHSVFDHHSPYEAFLSRNIIAINKTISERPSLLPLARKALLAFMHAAPNTKEAMANSDGFPPLAFVVFHSNFCNPFFTMDAIPDISKFSAVPLLQTFFSEYYSLIQRQTETAKIVHDATPIPLSVARIIAEYDSDTSKLIELLGGSKCVLDGIKRLKFTSKPDEDFAKLIQNLPQVVKICYEAEKERVQQEHGERSKPPTP